MEVAPGEADEWDGVLKNDLNFLFFLLFNFNIMKTKLFISGLAFMALTTLAIAQSADQAPAKPQTGTVKEANFVDANNNGICDNFENNGTNAANCKGPGAVSCCGQGKKQMMGRGQGMGAGSGMGQKRMGTGMGMGQGKGMGKNFVDADNNGICDKFEAATKK